MKNWLARFNTREQLSLLALAIAVPLYLLYMLAWSPLVSKRDDMALRNTATAESLARVDALVSQLFTLRQYGGAQRARRNMASVVNQTSAAAGLSVSRLQPNARGDIQVRFESADYSQLMAWLYEVEYGQGLIVREVSVSQTGAAGRVNASIRLGQGE